MKKAIIIVGILLAATTGTFAQAKKDSTAKKAKMAMIQYTCSMHPEVVSGKPGKCPKCGMALVVKKKESSKTPSMHKKPAMNM
jgi:hypothetical protein